MLNAVIVYEHFFGKYFKVIYSYASALVSYLSLLDRHRCFCIDKIKITFGNKYIIP